MTQIYSWTQRGFKVQARYQLSHLPRKPQIIGLFCEMYID